MTQIYQLLISLTVYLKGNAVNNWCMNWKKFTQSHTPTIITTLVALLFTTDFLYFIWLLKITAISYVKYNSVCLRPWTSCKLNWLPPPGNQATIQIWKNSKSNIMSIM